MPGLALLVHHVADLDEGGLLLVITEAVRGDISEDDLPDPFRLEVVVDLGGDICDTGPGVEQDGGDVRLPVLEGGHLESGPEVVDEMLSEGVAYNYEPVFCTGVAVPEGGKGEAWNSYFWDLMAEGRYVI